jgi:deoxycytidylate deaminase
MSYSKPCNNCIHLIKMVGIKRVIYTTDDGYIIEKGNMIANDHISRIEQLNIDNMKLCVMK